MFGGKGSTIVFYAAVAGFGAFVAMWLLDFAMIRADWCKGADAACVREWIGALSGWAAALAAAVTVLFLYRQNEEQKRQTQFLVGDSRPTIDAIQHQHHPENVVVHIVNWNRRPIIVRGIALTAKHYSVRLQDASISDKERPKAGFKPRALVNGSFSPPIPMHGWKDRAKGPCEVRVDLIARSEADGKRVTDWVDTTVRVEIIVAGEENYELNLLCPIAVAE